jgi:hypothetical protein
VLRSLISGALRSRSGAGTRSPGYRSTGASSGAGALGSLLGGSGRSAGRSPAGGGLGSLLGAFARRR